MNQSAVCIAIIGSAKRSTDLYGPLLKALKDDVELVSVWSRGEASARKLGEALSVPWHTDLHKLVRDTTPKIGIVAVADSANGEVGLMAVESGILSLSDFSSFGIDFRGRDLIEISAGNQG